MKLIKRIISKTGIKMVIAQDTMDGYAVFTAEEFSMGEGYRYVEFDGIVNFDEAISQAKHY